MPYRPRELVMRARDAATVLLATLDRDEMVQRFLDIYAAENRRPGRADRPSLYREQLETIRREAILAMVLRIEAALPKRLNVHVPVRETKRREKTKRGKEGAHRKKARAKKQGWDFAIPLLDLFREEFFVALGQALEWTDEDANEFWRDLELYESLAGPEPRKRSVRGRHAAASGPFVDRVAFLLDPSLMEQARRAAGRFEVELHAATDRILRKVLSRRRLN